jgi:hypothetical protein
MSPFHGSIVPDRFSDGGVGGDEYGFDGEGWSDPECISDSREFGVGRGAFALESEALFP